MKQIKKMLSIMLAMVMTLAMCSSVFAGSNTPAGSGNFKITIKDDVAGYEYAAYQIFSGDLAEEDGTKTLSNIVWGSSVDETKAAAAFQGQTAAQVAKTIEGKGNDSTEAKDFAAKIAGCLKDPVKTVDTQTTENGEKAYVLDGLTAGYYLVQNLSVPATDGAFTRYILQVVGDVAPTPKRDIPTPDKKILDDGEKTVNEASIGDEVKYQITGTMPSNINDYKEYYYLFTDTLSKGLTFKSGSIEVTVNGVDVTRYFSTKEYDPNGPADQKPAVGKYDEEKGTEIKVGINNLKGLSSIEGLGVGTITADTRVVLTYTAILNENAVIAGNGNVNDVKLTYSNNPNNSGDGTTTPPEEPDVPTPTHPTGESPKVEVVTYTTELTILKRDGDDKTKFLPGTEFTLSGIGVNVVLVTEEVFEAVGEGENGEYWKLKDGTYTTTAPTIADDETDNSDDYDNVTTKYNKTVKAVRKDGTEGTDGRTGKEVVGTVQEDGTVTFTGLGVGEYTITETKTLAGYNTIEPIKFTLTFNENNKFVSDNEKVTVGEDNKLDTAIDNYKGSLLPSTGGIGTTIFYIVGAVLVIGAAILLVTKKRMSKEA